MSLKYERIENIKRYAWECIVKWKRTNGQFPFSHSFHHLVITLLSDLQIRVGSRFLLKEGILIFISTIKNYIPGGKSDAGILYVQHKQWLGLGGFQNFHF